MTTPELPPKLQKFLDKAEASVVAQGRRFLVQRTGGTDFQHSITCPAHDDEQPSLSVNSENGKVVFFCHADCEKADILAEVGLTWADLDEPSRVVATYDYEDEDGNVLCQVIRREPKAFSQRRPDPAHPGRWINNMDGVPLVPFNLPQLAEALESGDDVWIVEGEKDARALWSAEHAIATTNQGGAAKWTKAHSEFFIGSESKVTIVADRDKAGYKGALKTYDSLLEVAGIHAELVLPREGKDAADHVKNHSLASFIPATVADLTALKNADDEKAESDFDDEVAAELNRIAVREAARRAHAAAQATGLFNGFASTSLREALTAPRQEAPWLFERLQRAGHKAFLVAQFKAGKTTVTGNVVRSLADHEPLFGRFAAHDLSGNVGVLDYELTEDDALDLFRDMGVRRLERIWLQSLRGTGFTLANDTHAEMLIAWCVQHDIEYLTLDPFGRAMKGFGEENSNDDVRAFLMRLDVVAKEANLLGLLMPVHTGRAAAEIGSERARGATVLDDDADARWILTRDAQGRRFFRADGRKGVGVDEFSLEFDAALNRLSSSDMSRQESAGERFIGPVLAHIENNPGVTLSALKKEVTGTDDQIAAAAKLCVKQGLVSIQVEGRAHRHFIATDAPSRKLVLSESAEASE